MDDIVLSFKEAWNGNWKAKTPHDASITLFRKKDDYGTPDNKRWVWMATKGEKKKFNEDEFLCKEHAAEDYQEQLEDIRDIVVSIEFEDLENGKRL